jgi:steroid delta-isomerase
MTRDDAEILASNWAAAWNDRSLDTVLEYFAEDVEFTSPTAAAVVGRFTVRGKDALREYWTAAMRRIGSIEFTLDHVVWDAHTRELAIIYTAHIDGRSRRVSENLTFGTDGLVISAEVFHGVGG